MKKLLLERGIDQGYYPKSAKYLVISDSPNKEEAAKREFEAEGFQLKLAGGSRYLGAYIGTREELEAWV